MNVHVMVNFTTGTTYAEHYEIELHAHYDQRFYQVHELRYHDYCLIICVL